MLIEYITSIEMASVLVGTIFERLYLKFSSEKDDRSDEQYIDSFIVLSHCFRTHLHRKGIFSLRHAKHASLFSSMRIALKF